MIPYNNFPLVSIVITTHNRPTLLKRAIDSAVGQTYPKTEIIVVDDASEKETQAVCSQYKNIKYYYIPKEESKGGNHARNLGIKASSGKYVSLLDDDDYWKPEKIEKQVNTLESNPQCGICYTDYYREEVCPDGSTILHEDKINRLFQGDMHVKIWACIIITTSKIMARRDILIQIGIFDEELGFWQDYELLMRLSQVTAFINCCETLTIIRDDHKEKGRLTNNYYDWLKAIKYIDNKHKSIYSNAPLKYRIIYKIFCYCDGYARASKRNLRKECIIMWCKAFPFRVLHKCSIWIQRLKLPEEQVI